MRNFKVLALCLGLWLLGTVVSFGNANVGLETAEFVPGSYVIQFAPASYKEDRDVAISRFKEDVLVIRADVLRKRGAAVAHSEDPKISSPLSIGDDFHAFFVDNLDDVAYEQYLEEFQSSSGIVKSISKNYIMKANHLGSDDTPSCKNQAESSNPFVTWGISRVSTDPSGPMGGDNNYVYDYEAGKGVHVYVLDTGTPTVTNEFGHRLHSIPMCDDCSIVDGEGHGSHVIGTIGSVTYGIAKRATVISIKVLDDDGKGSLQSLITGMQLVLMDATQRGGGRPFVINLSLGFEVFISAVNEAIATLSAWGGTVVVAAGNSNVDACTTSPSSSPDAITVGNVNKNGRRSRSSNYGSCVDIFAPGESIESLGVDGTTVSTKSGTSMAAPHVAGAAAIYLSKNPLAKVTEVRRYLRDKGAKDAMDLYCTYEGFGQPGSTHYLPPTNFAQCNQSDNIMLHLPCPVAGSLPV